MDDYITEAGKISWHRAEPFIHMLGEHELQSFKERLASIKHARHEKIVSFQADFGAASTEVDRVTLIKNKMKEKLYEKKLIKILRLKNKNKDKDYKRFLLLKRFEEDEESEKQLSKHQKEVRATLLEKYRQARIKQE
jgi:5'-3' exonuclease